MEGQVAVGTADDAAAAVIFGADPCADALVKDAAVEFDQIAVAAAAIAGRRSVQQIEFGDAGPDQHAVGQLDRMIERQLPAATLRSAEHAARTTASAAKAAAGATRARRRRGGRVARSGRFSGLPVGRRRGVALRRLRPPLGAASRTTATEAPRARTRLRLAETAAEIDPPADLRIGCAVEIHRTLVERDEHAADAGGAIRESGLDLGRQQREAIAGVVAAVAVVVDRKVQPLDHRRRPVEPELQIAALFGEEKRIAAGRRLDLHRLAGAEVVIGDIVGNERRRAELRHRRRRLVAVEACEQRQIVGQPPIERRAPAFERGEIARVFDLAVQRQRNAADLADIIVGIEDRHRQRSENARRVSREVARRDDAAAVGTAIITQAGIGPGDRGADRAGPALDHAARDIGVAAEALLAAVETVAAAAQAFGKDALVAVGIIARNRPAPRTEHAVGARRTRPVLRPAVAAQRIADTARAGAEKAEAVGLVEPQACRQVGDLVEIADDRAVDDIGVAGRQQATPRVAKVALALEQHRLMLPPPVQVEAAILPDRDDRGFQLALELPALRRDARLALHRHLFEIGLEHEIHHAIGRGITILQRDFLGENLDLGDRFGRKVAHRAEAADPAPIDQDNGAPAAAPAPRPRDRFERRQQFLDRRGAIAGDRGFIEFGLGRDIGVDLPRDPRRGHDDLVGIVDIVVGRGARARNDGDGRLILRHRGRDSHNRGAGQQQGAHGKERSNIHGGENLYLVF